MWFEQKERGFYTVLMQEECRRELRGENSMTDNLRTMLALATVAITLAVSSLAEQAMRVPEGCRAAAGTVAEVYTNTGWAKEIVHEKTGIELVYIPAGTFLMGTPNSYTKRQADETQHQVTLTRGFYMGKYEVTQEQWETVMGNNPSYFKNAGKNAPVECVSWKDCQAFCGKLGKEYRLPTEAEWEYACRAGTTTLFHYGDKLDKTMAHCDGGSPLNKGEGTVPVGLFKPNAWGLYDMHGNATELCSDLYGGLTPRPVTDPTGPSASTISGRQLPYQIYVAHGGCFTTPAEECRSARRIMIPDMDEMKLKLAGIFVTGFRPVRSLP